MFLQKINQKPSTKLSGPRLFGFDIEPLYHARLQIGSQPITTIKNNKCKKSLEDITSRSQQYK
ncbi:34026_t:CDS:2 [Gigaspora margarita]|uniref:34026_t:CDS:1 n=1 Tax=Gigaspora margarita TaxID=4874 RepID=A0ABN7VFL1_GIGMA|nr:34026_t:CDS:2 [Gigaspora margarita]